MADKKMVLKAIKIGFLGDSKVGKTSLCHAIMDFEFQKDVLSTIGDVKLETKYKLKDGNEIKLILWDTAGQERFRSVALTTLKAVMGIIVVFDITSEETFENVKVWLNEIKENLNEPYLVLFGNKIDRITERKISYEEALDFADEYNLKYFETSAKTREGLDEGLSYIINQVYEKIVNKDKKDDNTVIVLEKKEEKEEEEEEYTIGCFGRKKKKKKKKVTKNN